MLAFAFKEAMPLFREIIEARASWAWSTEPIFIGLHNATWNTLTSTKAEIASSELLASRLQATVAGAWDGISNSYKLSMSAALPAQASALTYNRISIWRGQAIHGLQLCTVTSPVQATLANASYFSVGNLLALQNKLCQITAIAGNVVTFATGTVLANASNVPVVGATALLAGTVILPGTYTTQAGQGASIIVSADSFTE